VSEEHIQRLVDNLNSNPDVRNRFRSAPADVIEEHGITLTEEQRTRITSNDFSQTTDEELTASVTTASIRRWL
jgi:hypothetical protein